MSIEKKLEICRRHKMGQSYTSLLKEYSLGKLTILDIVQSEDRLTEYALEIRHASEALLEDLSMKSWIRLSIYGFYRSDRVWADFNSESKTEKLYGNSDCSVADVSDTSAGSSENSEGTCFKASSGWLTKFKARHGIRIRTT